jgi:hypothetical protein
MSEGSKWTPGKIFLLVIGILAGLGILCCGAGYFFLGDKIRSITSIAKDSVAFGENLQKEFGPTAMFQLLPNGKAKFILAIGVEGDLTPERVAQVQNAAWKVFAESYRENGFVPVTQVAVGRPEKGVKAGRGEVSDWAANLISVEELVKRTGVAAPPVSAIIPVEHGVVTVQVDGGNAQPDAPKPADAQKKPDEETKDKEGGGGGGK